jgi:hypothetical protein
VVTTAIEGDEMMEMMERGSLLLAHREKGRDEGFSGAVAIDFRTNPMAPVASPAEPPMYHGE